MLKHTGRIEPPFEGCVSAVVFDERTARIARTYKDQGERRLAKDMATLMARIVPPTWETRCVVYIPASSAARRQRGFDHAELLAQQVAGILGLPCIPALARPRSRDQRALSRRARLENMIGRFEVLPGASLPPNVLLIDDVYTTGATLFDATDALKRGGAKAVCCLTFARVW